jgi:predicted dehydrogenase
MLKIGVLGAGHLGKIHLRLLQQSEKYELVGFYDPNQENADKISKELDTNILVQLPLLSMQWM